MAAIGQFHVTNLVLSTLAVVSTVCFVDVAQATGGNHYGVTISKAPTQNMSFANGVYSATADGANLNVNDLTNALASGNVEVTTGNGAGGDKMGDLHVDAGFTWTSAYGLTLDAYHSIFVTRAVVDAGTGALTLTNNDGGTGGTFNYGPNGSITIWSLTNTLTIDGQVFTLVGDIKTLASDIAANPSGTYALAASYDASKDGTYGHTPIETTLGGVFDGLGNTIQNLTIAEQRVRGHHHSVGLFSASTGVVRNVGLSSVTVSSRILNGYTGALIAYNSGSIDQVWVTGTLTSRGDVGAISGINGGTIADSWSNAGVTGCAYGRDGVVAGGLAGVNYTTIENSYATGAISLSYGTCQYQSFRASVTGTVDRHSDVVSPYHQPSEAGGLVGANSGMVIYSYASGSVFGGGGLVGANSGTIAHSHASGNVVGGGGLVGLNGGTIADSYATGSVSSGYTGGGLVGENFTGGIVEESFATGQVTGGGPYATAYSGGLVGTNGADIQNCYATGTVEGSAGDIVYTAGLSGVDYDVNGNEVPSISTSYSIGLVVGEKGIYPGGFLGWNEASNLSNNYWDTQTSKQNDGVYGGNLPNITGLTTQQLQSGLPAGFDPAIWAESPNINHGFPYLIANPPPQ